MPESKTPSQPRLCGTPTVPEQKRATLWCQRESGHEPPHRVYGGNGQVIREWTTENPPSESQDA